MKTTTINLLACPVCQNTLTLQLDASVIIKTGNLHCSRYQQDYPIEHGIPHFIKPEILSGFNHRFARLYNGFSWGYPLFSRIAFAYIGMDEEAGRRDDPERGPCLVKGWKKFRKGVGSIEPFRYLKIAPHSIAGNILIALL